MSIQRIIGVAIDGPSVVLGEGAILEHTHVIVQAPSPGRVLFTEPSTAIVVTGRAVQIRHCVISHASPAIRL